MCEEVKSISDCWNDWGSHILRGQLEPFPGWLCLFETGGSPDFPGTRYLSPGINPAAEKAWFNLLKLGARSLSSAASPSCITAAVCITIYLFAMK